MALAARLLPCGSVAKVFSVAGSRGGRTSTTRATMRAGSQLPACFAHPSETWDGLTLGRETFPTWKEGYATSHTYSACLLPGEGNVLA